jgi:outer membrane protein assembly factor BamB
MKKNLLLLILLFTILGEACSATGLVPRANSSCAQVEHEIVGNSHFQLLWSKSDISLFGNESNPLMQGTNANVFIAAIDSNYNSPRIFAFDTKTGDLLWHQKYTPPATIFTNNVNLYIGNYDNIQEYDLQTGQLIKEVRFPNVGLVENMYFNDEFLYALTSSGRWLTYNINSQVSSLSEPLLPYTPFIIENGILYLHDVEGFKAIETNTQTVLWKYSIDEQINIHPLFINDMIIVRTRSGSIYQINKKTGDLVWMLDAHTISNVAIDTSRAYFLTSDGYLKVLDQKSGQEIQTLEFSPASFTVNSPTLDKPIGAYDIWVDSQNGILVLSLGDSCQLKAFKINLP